MNMELVAVNRGFAGNMKQMGMTTAYMAHRDYAAERQVFDQEEA